MSLVGRQVLHEGINSLEQGLLCRMKLHLVGDDSRFCNEHFQEFVCCWVLQVLVEKLCMRASNMNHGSESLSFTEFIPQDESCPLKVFRQEWLRNFIFLWNIIEYAFLLWLVVIHIFVKLYQFLLLQTCGKHLLPIVFGVCVGKREVRDIEKILKNLLNAEYDIEFG